MTKRKPVVPRFEPEVVQAIANKKHPVDREKVATTALSCFSAHGVGLSSRWNKAEELQQMAQMLEGVSAPFRQIIESIYCDSKAEAVFTIILKQCDKEDAEIAVEQFAAACRRRIGGHNGITASGSGFSLDLDPDWYWGDD